ncbi:uncharacterized protein LOC131078113 [Cryptomeria japonica]|uniref:uncharacterized protein LOC131078113 n=1 Tax=Cryptomeria japonica TaxID=3369 RepID=UPI0027DA8520|nr:uncharacterized protein LOC131078113 [Cryptomeria japonica]
MSDAEEEHEESKTPREELAEETSLAERISTLVRSGGVIATLADDTDVILGIQWMETLNQYTQSFKRMEFSFEVDGKKVVLRRMSNGGPREISTKRMEAIFRHDEVVWATHCLISTKPVKGQLTHYQDGELQSVLDGHSLVFIDIPPGIPPQRGYYRRFVNGFSQLGAPLTDLTKKGSFHWNAQAQQTFDKLKEVMSTCPVLALPNFTRPFILECDASGEGIGAVLMQDHHPIAFESWKLLGVEQ